MSRLLPVLLLLGCFESEVSTDPPGPRRGPSEEDGGAGGEDSGTAAPDGGGPGDGGGAADGGGGDGGATDGGGDDGGADVDAAEACHEAIEGWSDRWANFEEEVVRLTNQARARGADCGTMGRFPATTEVVMDAHLRCAARYHSYWMATTGNFSHESPGGDLGDDPWERMASAGYSGSGVGENIAAGYGSASAVVQGWLDSDGHCANLMSSQARTIGVGYYAGGSYGSYWTQNFGR